ncbi:MAG: inositol monophosphatase [Sulfurovaceae bacterium]|nr:inositol monophosphatase [Sulfurovaceae bacterium]MDD5360351.1 inositol monophosphatase [Sulfurovaceae bacterium]
MNDFLLATLKANKEIFEAINSIDKKSMYAKHSQGAGGDISSGFDLAAEKIFYENLNEFGSIESEESGVMNEGKCKIIIDPIDGSDNIVSNFSYYGTSVAKLNSDGVLEDAMVCNLATKEVFWISSQEVPMYGKLFEDKWNIVEENNFSKIGIFERAYDNPKIVKILKNNKIKFRSPGAIALSLAYARWVDFVLFVGPIRIYDVAAGLALCKGLEVLIQEDFAIVSKDKKISGKLFDIIAKNFAGE